MDRNEAKKILRKAFAALTKREKARLAYHAEKGTRVLCGADGVLYADSDGGG